MAIISPLAGTGGISDATINTMLQSGDPNLIKQANEYIADKEKQAEERGTKSFLDFFDNIDFKGPKKPRLNRKLKKILAIKKL